MKVENLTPHAVVVANGDERITFPPSGRVARVATNLESAEPLNGVPTWHQTFGEIVDLPEHADGVMYIVSGLLVSAAEAAGRRTDDLLVPGQQIRDDEGRVVGCRGFIRN